MKTATRIKLLGDLLSKGELSASDLARKLYPAAQYSQVSSIYRLVATHYPTYEKELRIRSEHLRRIRHAASLRCRVYDKTFFKHWSAAMAWVVGVIASDGCLYLKNEKPTLEIGSTDKDLVEKIQTLLSTDYKIIVKKTIRDGKQFKDTYQLDVYNCPEYFEFFDSLGIGPRKSLSLHLPIIPKEFFWDFLRGYVDGDGSICEYPRPLYGTQFQVSIHSGSKDFIVQLSQYIEKELQLRTSVYPSNGTFTIVFAGKKGQALGKNLYKNATIETSLERKYTMFQKWNSIEIRSH